MSYARFGCEDSDVYVYDDCTFGLVCHSCLFRGIGSIVDCDDDPKKMLLHLDEHDRAGHNVAAAKRAVNELLKDQPS